MLFDDHEVVPLMDSDTTPSIVNDSVSAYPIASILQLNVISPGPNTDIDIHDVPDAMSPLCAAVAPTADPIEAADQAAFPPVARNAPGRSMATSRGTASYGASVTDAVAGRAADEHVAGTFGDMPDTLDGRPGMYSS